jgi:SAM-dependent methyltransferase
MTTSRQWQLDAESARRYEEIVVPLILGPAASALVDWAALASGERVLDVGCGTGIAARFAKEQVGPAGSVTGVDVNEGMLAMARELAPEITFQTANAMSLPFPDDSFERVICAQVLQFVPERWAVVAEMARVLTDGGGVALSVWGPIEESPYFDAQVRAATEHLGADVGAGLAAGFTLTGTDELIALLSGAGLAAAEISSITLDLQLGKLDETIPRHIMATPLAGGFVRATPEVQSQIVREVSDRLAGFTCDDGSTTVPFRINMARARKI